MIRKSFLQKDITVVKEIRVIRNNSGRVIELIRLSLLINL